MANNTGLRGEGRAGGTARFKVRTRVLASFFVLFALLCVGRLYYLQVIQGDEYAAKANRVFLTPTNSLFSRGTIYFTAKDGAEIAAAADESGVLLAVQPPKITDPSALYNELNKVVPLSKSDFIAKATRPGTQYVVVLNHLSTTTGATLQSLNATGTVIAQDSWRYYPGKTLAAQTIGFVAYNGDVLEGRYGLEQNYEKVLNHSNEDLYTNFFVELFAGASQVLSGNTEGDLVTTIEPSVQTELERVVAAYTQKWHPQIAGGIIMDPQTGAIYAIAQSPTFDLNDFSGQTDPSIFANSLVQNDYEMGSIIKPLTMAAGLDSGVITQQTTYDDKGCITVDTARICNYDLRARGVIPMQEILNQSLNVGASFVATQLGPDLFRTYFEDKYQLGKKTGIDLPGEVSGLISNLSSPRQLEYDEASFGQGIAITPMETVRALSTLANGGRLITPHLGRAVRTAGGIEMPIAWGSGVQVLSASTTQQISQMLTEVVDVNHILHKDHYSIAAKTGTAQIADHATGGYYPNSYLHSFFGYLPSYGARFIIFLYALKPVGAEYSSQTWASSFNDLTSFLINYYNIPPDR